MRRTRALVMRFALVAVSVVVGAGAIILFDPWPSEPSEPYGPLGETGVETVEVTRRDVSVVISIDATTVAGPEYVVVAPETGRVNLAFEQALGHHPTLAPTDEPTEEPDEETPSEPGDEAGENDPGPGNDGDLTPVETPVTAEQLLLRMDSGAEVKAPATGVFVNWLVPDGTEVKQGTPVAVLKYGGFALVGSLPATDAYRLMDGVLSAVGSIVKGPSGFDCELLQAHETTEAEPEAVPRVVCAIGDDVRVFPSLPGRLALDSGQSEDVLTLPVTAVSGGADIGEVGYVADDGSTEVRTVSLGVTDGAVVEIVDGLEEGATVTATPPPLVR
ncbi:MAG TPA: hypothetical protein H9881_06940 [Candidatus Stackebrandtia excrementipullorum]|nr:hypothetical protein [Candidatus Stackebrandtia excrementipullorum]